MTTSDSGEAAAVLPGVAAVGTRDIGDEAVFDRIAANLLGSIPSVAPSAVPNPDPDSQAALTAARTTPPLASTSGLPSPTAIVSSAATPFPGIGVQTSPLIDAAIRHSQIPAPMNLESAASQTALASLSADPTLGLSSATRTATLPPGLVIHDGTLPRLFDDASGSWARSDGGSPAYYFLTPPRSHVESGPPAFDRRLFDVNDIRRDFPILNERVHGRKLVWLDNAATTQKPQAVINRLVHYYSHEYSNVHRAAHELAARSTEAYENARDKLRQFISAGASEEIIFVRGTTEAINLVAGSYGRKFIGKADEIVLSTLEHHSNIVPWQFLAEQVGAVIRVVPVTDRGEVLLSDFERTLTTRTKFVALTHVSNALGTILPVREMIDIAHRRGARVLIDGAQAVSHFPVNVQALDADFYVLSGHKMFGPSAIGVLYGKKALLDEMPPWQGGGNMIQHVTFENSTFADPPSRFEAGTAALGPAVGLGAAVDYLQRIGMDNIARHERELLSYATDALARIPGVRLIGTAPEKAGVVSFVTNQIPAEEMGKILDQEGIAVRAGHHCAQPTMARFGLESTVRPSLALYNTHEEIDHLARTIRRALQK